MTYIAGARLHGGNSKTVWVHKCSSLWDAVEKVKLLIEQILPETPSPQPKGEHDHLYAGEMERWRDQDFHRRSDNDARIKDFEWIKPWPFDEPDLPAHP